MSDSIFKAEPQTYRFEFGCDEKIYSTQFIGELPLGADTGILREVRKHLLEDSSKVIWSFLEHNHIGFSHSTSGIKALEQDKVMEQADFLLHSHSCAPIDECLSSPAFYYAAMDCQERFTGSHRKGCYYVMKKTASAPSPSFTTTPIPTGKAPPSAVPRAGFTRNPGARSTTKS